MCIVYSIELRRELTTENKTPFQQAVIFAECCDFFSSEIVLTHKLNSDLSGSLNPSNRKGNIQL